MKYLFLLLFAGQLAAQSVQDKINKIKNDPNITWAAEFYLEHEHLDGALEGRSLDLGTPQDFPDGTSLGRQFQSYNILKLQAPLPRTSWATYLRDASVQEGVPRYLDANLTKPMTKADKDSRLYFLDTITTFDVNTFQEIKIPNVRQIDLNNIIGYSMRTIMYYNKKENFFYSLPLAMGVKSLRKDPTNNTIGTEILFWMPIAFNGQPLLVNNNPDIHFAKFVQISEDFSAGTTLKGDISPTMSSYLDEVLKLGDKVFATSTTEVNQNAKPLEKKELDAIIIARDTIDVFHPETFEVTPLALATKENPVAFKPGHILAWDTKRKMFVVAAYSLGWQVSREETLRRLIFHVYPHRRTK